jgi:hypothetical protein
MPPRVAWAVLVAVCAAAAVAGLASAAQQDKGGKAEFLADCPFSHRLVADPIVFPGRTRAGHLHDFFGNRSANGRSTSAKLRRRGRTTCAPSQDRSSYWVPSLVAGGRVLRPSQVTVYYTVEPQLADEVRPFPRDLRIVAGNARERRPVPGAPNVWGCLGSPVSGKDFARCPPGSSLELLLNFPGCWDGRRSDSRDHQSHMAYAQGARCPATHPVAVPEIQFKIRWPTRGGDGVKLSSGGGYGAHGDFMNGWDAGALQRRIDACLRPVVKCGADGRP